MAYQKTIYSGLVILLLFGGCGLKEGVVQKEPKSFLWFTGNTQDAIVYIDDLSPIILNEKPASTGAEGEMNTKKSNKIHYELSPGKHSIVVKIKGEEIVNRIVLLGSGITKEIKIP